ncbi:T-cell surface antigen CD2 isoform X2 [Hypomesus transpacificus]|uniref:T-cell surface antigen CD2 isoform X2 n=1 Tax=Hypomesus transpacificus TaxID=137520 RepID=UPI001F07589D|nr:T-cell surface antigen CD2 isoform X2 [Hypomesus transpacificus]
MVSGERLLFLSAPGGVLSLLFLQGVGALASQVINKTEGESVLFQFNSFRREVQYDVVWWEFNRTRIAEKSNGAKPEYPSTLFGGRLEMNTGNFSLTVKNLELRDSGTFSVVADVAKGAQPATQCIPLQVYKSITEAKIDFNTTWQSKSGCCDVWVSCSSPGHADVSYTWKINNQTHHLPQVMLPLESTERVIVNCTAQNPVSHKTASQTVTCTEETTLDSTGRYVIIGVSTCGVLLLFLIVALVCYKCRKTEANTDLIADTIYADITDNIEMKDKPASTTIKPDSIYETVKDHVVIPANKPLTVYDTIQFDRTPAPDSAGVSQYQHVL